MTEIPSTASNESDTRRMMFSQDGIQGNGCLESEEQEEEEILIEGNQHE